MSKTLTRLFDQRSDAEGAVRALETLGVPRDDISVVASNNAGSHGTVAHGAARVGDGVANSGEGVADAAGHIDHDGDVSRGTSTGALLGGAGGLLAGLGLLAIPGLGPIVAAGWLLSTAAGAGLGAMGGAATGGIVGALKGAGHTDEEAHVYSEGVRRGSTLLSARVPDALAAAATQTLMPYNGVDAATRGADYRASGWSTFDETAAPYTADEMNTERSRLSRM